jgi:hypothetical protein
LSVNEFFILGEFIHALETITSSKIGIQNHHSAARTSHRKCSATLLPWSSPVFPLPMDWYCYTFPIKIDYIVFQLIFSTLNAILTSILANLGFLPTRTLLRWMPPRMKRWSQHIWNHLSISQHQSNFPWTWDIFQTVSMSNRF